MLERALNIKRISQVLPTLLLFITLLYSVNVLCQEPQPIFIHYTVEDDLPSSEVHHVMQDSKGYMWFATNNGVSRFDGYKFQNYSLSEGLPDNTVFNIYEDYQGRIWFISFSGRLSFFKDGYIESYKYSEALEKEVTNLYKGSFHVDKLDQLFIRLGSGHGYLKIDDGGRLTRHGMDSSYATGIVHLEDALFVYSRQRGSGTNTFAIIKKTDTTIFQVDHIDKRTNFQGLLMKNGNVLYTSGRSAITISPDLTVKNYMLSNDILSSFEDSKKNVWIGTYQGGIRYYKNGLASRSTSTYLDGLSVSSITQDSEGGMWFTTLEHGLYYLSSINFLTYNIESGLDAEMVTCLTSDKKNTLYAGLRDGTVYSFKDNIISKINPVASLAPAILSLYFDTSASHLWVGASAKDAFVDNENVHIVRGYGGSHDIIQGADGAIWMGNHRRLKKLVDQQIVYTSEFHMSAFRIAALHEDKDGTLWVGNLHGLWKFEDSSFVSAHEFDPLLRYAVSDISEFNGNLCIATKGVGLLILKQDSILQIGQEAGLASDNINGLFIDGSTIWLATDRGVNSLAVHGNDNADYEIDTYSVMDGLASNEVNQVIKFNNQIWVATNRGLTFFNPNDLPEFNYKPKMHINGISIMHQDTMILNTYDLAYDQNQFEVSYIGLSYENAGRLQYRLKLEGVDSGWVYTRNTNMRYTSVPPGSYIFYVSAKTSHGTWSDNLETLRIIINPPFWKKWWFTLGIVLVTIGVVFSFFKIRILTYNRDVVRELMIAFLNQFRKSEFLVEKIGNRVVKIKIMSILWIRAADNYVEIVTKDKKYLVRSTLDKMHRKLPAELNFLKVHRSFIIQLSKVQSVEKNAIRIDNEIIPVSDTYRDNQKLVKDHLLLMKNGASP